MERTEEYFQCRIMLEQFQAPLFRHETFLTDPQLSPQHESRDGSDSETNTSRRKDSAIPAEADPLAIATLQKFPTDFQGIHEQLREVQSRLPADLGPLPEESYPVPGAYALDSEQHQLDDVQEEDEEAGDGEETHESSDTAEARFVECEVQQGKKKSVETDIAHDLDDSPPVADSEPTAVSETEQPTTKAPSASDDPISKMEDPTVSLL